MNERIQERAVVQTPVAIVGMACMFPRARGLEDYWANVRDGVDAITDVPASHWNPADYFDADPAAPDKTYGRRGGFLEAVDFEPMAFGISPRDLEATDTTQLLGMHVAREALADAGYGSEGREFDRDRASVILGVTGTLPSVIPLGARLGHPIWRRALAEAGVDAETAEDVVARISDAYVPWQENSFPGLLGNVVAGRIANRLDLHGTNCVVDAACASSLSAIHLAILELESGRSDLVLSGGLDTFNDPFMYMCFSKTPALSPSGDARPFDQAGDGTILGEGVGVVVLKRLADAERDGDRIYAVIRGMGSASDGKGRAVYAPDADGQARAMRVAYRMAGVRPDSVELVEAHGTGTRVGDATEIGGLSSVFREARAEGTWCALGSVKSMIGHTKAAAGAAGVIKVAMALHNRVLPPTIKVERPNDAVAPASTPFYVNTQLRPWLAPAEHPRRAGVSAFGFGGSNFHCVLEEYERDEPRVDWDGRTQILAFSGPDRETIRAAMREFSSRVAGEDADTLRGEAARTRAHFDAGAGARLLLVIARDGKPAQESFATAERMLSNDAAHAVSPAGVYFGEGTQAGELGLVFPGQGAQYVGMLRDLACRFSCASERLNEAERECPGLTEHIFPHPAFDDQTRADQGARLRATEVAQPAIGAVSLAALDVLRHFEVPARSACGHSYGELTALCAAGRLSAADLHRLSRLRGRLMAVGEGDRGSMLAVQAELAQVEGALREHDLDLVLANRNAPRQAVLSGSTREIERAERRLGEAGLRVKRLSVAAAFHSSLVAQASAPFADALAGVDLADVGVPVYANATGGAYPARSTDARELLAAQLTSPVEFVRCIESMFAAGVRTFVEVGPGRRLCALVEEILDGRPAAAVAVDASSGRRPGMVDLARALAQLAALGHAVALSRWDEGALARHEQQLQAKKPAMTVRISGANVVVDRPKRPPRAPRPAPTVLAPVLLSPAPVSSSPLVSPLLQASQDGLAALLRLQEQTADVHRRFLESQEQAMRVFAALVEQSPTGAASEVAAPAHAPRLKAVLPAAPPTPVPAPTDLVAPILLAIVSEKTGYPIEMLDLSMGLDADLGIDSIKRVEILSALQEKLPGAPAIGPEQLGSLRTLGQIADHLGRATTVLATLPRVGQPLPSAPGAASDRLARVLLEIVSDKTGYPVQMLDLSMGLDADLGIDSIKRVEILSALQERLPEAPPFGPEQLGALQTLAQIVDRLRGEAAPTPTPTPSRESVPSHDAADRDVVGRTLLEVVAEKTGYPIETLDLSMGLDADLGIDSIKRVEILSALQEKLPRLPTIGPEQLGDLHTLARIVDVLNTPAAGRGPTVPSSASSSSPATARGPVVRLLPTLCPVGAPEATVRLPPRARIWVTDSGDALSGALVSALRANRLDAELVPLRTDPATVPDDLAGLVVVSSPTMGDDGIAAAFARIRQVAGALRRAGKRSGAVLATISRLGGGFGLDGRLVPGTVEPTSGALAGLTKTAAQEWPEVTCHALDVDVDEDTNALADRVTAWLLGSGPVEIGLGPTGPCTIGLECASSADAPAAAAAPAGAAVHFGTEDVVLITGGARGVTAEVAVALAEAGQPSLVLVGRSPEPSAEPDWLIGLSHEAEIKHAIVERAQHRLEPRQVEAEYRRLEAAREILRNIARIEAAGSSVSYRSVDVRDRDAVAAFVEHVQAKHGPITGIVHGAGVLADRRIEDKTDEDFDRVYGTKVEGLRALLAAIDRRGLAGRLRALVTFSSSTARFGRRGQADYAAANEALNKIALHEAARRPGCRVLSIGWGPWDGGMVTPGLKQMFFDEGIGVIDLRAGARFLVDELASSSSAVEVVVLGAGSRVPSVGVAGPRGPGEGLRTVLEREVSLATHGFLGAHVLDGRAVLPVVISLEWLAHAALHDNPGLLFVGVDGLRVFKGLILDADGSARVQLRAGPPRRRGDQLVVSTELRSLARGAGGEGVLHARADVILALDKPAAPAAGVLPEVTPIAHTVAELYESALFHGPLLQGLDHIEGAGDRTLLARCRAASAPREWMEEPVRGRWLTDPLALDCGMQAVIVWSFSRTRQVSLPVSLGCYRQFAAFPAGGTRIVVRIKAHDEHRAVADVEWIDDESRIVARLDDYECVIDASLASAFRRNRIGPAARARA